MSKRKHFHSIGSGKKMFQYAALDNAGLPRRFPPKKKTAHAAANNVDGRAEKVLVVPIPPPMIPKVEEEIK